MIKGGVGGGNTKTGINFEGEVDLLTLISKKKGYIVNGYNILYNGVTSVSLKLTEPSNLLLF